jgi:rod shape-determining protein MreB
MLSLLPGTKPALIYIEFNAKRIRLTLADSRHSLGQVSLEIIPEVAVQQDNKGSFKLLAVGDEARRLAATKGVKCLNPFDHVRTPLADFYLAEILLKQLVKRVLPRKLFAKAPLLIIQPSDEYAGGLTMIEERALQELAFAAGAKDSLVYQGPRLTGLQDFNGLKLQQVKAF